MKQDYLIIAPGCEFPRVENIIGAAAAREQSFIVRNRIHDTQVTGSIVAQLDTEQLMLLRLTINNIRLIPTTYTVKGHASRLEYFRKLVVDSPDRPVEIIPNPVFDQWTARFTSITPDEEHAINQAIQQFHLVSFTRMRNYPNKQAYSSWSNR